MKINPLHKEFSSAVAFVNSYKDPFPADLLLKLYAYYKIANQNFEHPGSKTPLINAFKANALFQAKDVQPDEAMRLYIDLVNEELRPLTVNEKLAL